MCFCTGRETLHIFFILQSQDNLQGWMTEPTNLSAGAEEKKESVPTQLMKHKHEVGVSPEELGSANAPADHKERTISEIRQDSVYRSSGRPEKTDMIKSLVMDQDASRNCELYGPVSGNCAAVESSEER